MKAFETVEDVRISDAAIRVGHGFDGTWIWAAYDIGGYQASVRAQPRAPFDGPHEVSVGLDASGEGIYDAVDLAVLSGGITTEVLRSVPLSDARKLLRRLRAEVLAKEQAEDAKAYELPSRLTSAGDWIAFARVYNRSKSRNPQQPLVHLASATGLSPNTVAARVRRAKELGLLKKTGTTSTGGDDLTLAGDARCDPARKEAEQDGERD